MICCKCMEKLSLQSKCYFRKWGDRYYNRGSNKKSFIWAFSFLVKWLNLLIHLNFRVFFALYCTNSDFCMIKSKLWSLKYWSNKSKPWKPVKASYMILTSSKITALAFSNFRNRLRSRRQTKILSQKNLENLNPKFWKWNTYELEFLLQIYKLSHLNWETKEEKHLPHGTLSIV